MYVVALPACPAFWALPKRDSLRLDDNFAFDLMDLRFTLPRSANLDLGMLLATQSNARLEWEILWAVCFPADLRTMYLRRYDDTGYLDTFSYEDRNDGSKL